MHALTPYAAELYAAELFAAECPFFSCMPAQLLVQ